LNQALSESAMLRNVKLDLRARAIELKSQMAGMEDNIDQIKKDLSCWSSSITELKDDVKAFQEFKDDVICMFQLLRFLTCQP
jgi:hypothetical protein